MTRLAMATAVILNIAVPFAAQPGSSPSAPPSTAKSGAGTNTLKDDFEKNLAEIDKRAEGIKTLRARFHQKKHTPLLKKPLESQGTVAIKGERTRWETLEPRKSVMTIDVKALRIYYPEQRVVEVYDLGDDVREFSGSPLPRLSKLRESFSIGEVRASDMGGRDDDAKELALELRPRTSELKEHVRRVRVLIETGVPAVRRIDIEDVDGERTEIDFKDVEVNKEIEDADVAMVAPPGTREVHPLGKMEAKPKEAGK